MNVKKNTKGNCMKHLGGEKKRLKLEKLNENFHSEKIRKTKSREI